MEMGSSNYLRAACWVVLWSRGRAASSIRVLLRVVVYLIGIAEEKYLPEMHPSEL